MANIQNLRPIQSTSEARELGRKGGIASGEARRKKATMLSVLEKTLDQTNSKGLTYRELATLGLIKGAMNGKVENYKFIMELMGELNSINSNEINENIQNIADLINNPSPNRGEKDVQ